MSVGVWRLSGGVWKVLAGPELGVLMPIQMIIINLRPLVSTFRLFHMLICIYALS